LPPDTQFDLFRGTAAMKQDELETYPSTLSHQIKMIAILLLLLFFHCSIASLYLIVRSDRHETSENRKDKLLG
jgi:hypothetical protein